MESEEDITTNDVFYRDPEQQIEICLTDYLDALSGIISEEIDEDFDIYDRLFRKRAKQIFAGCIRPGSDDVEEELVFSDDEVIYHIDAGDGRVVERFVNRMDGGVHEFYDSMGMAVENSQLIIYRL